METEYHEIIIDTNKYSGNFEREMGSFIFDILTEYGKNDVLKYAKEHDRAGDLSDVHWAWNPDWYEGALELQQHEKGCWESQRMEETPGFVTNGMGREARAEDEPTWDYPSSQSVAFRFNRLVTEAEVESVIARAKLFAEVAKDADGYSKVDVEILNVRLVRCVQKSKCERLYPIG